MISLPPLAALLARSAAALGLAGALAGVVAAEERGLFTDPEDGALDASEWLLDRKGFLPVPILITEPAIGYGGGLAAMFLRPRRQAGR